MYSSRDSSVHNTAGVVIRQIVSSMFERLNSFVSQSGSFDWGEGQEAQRGQLPMQASDAYLLFQVGSGKLQWSLSIMVTLWPTESGCYREVTC